MCKIVRREGTANLVVIPALPDWLRRYREKTRGVLEIAPPRAARVYQKRRCYGAAFFRGV